MDENALIQSGKFDLLVQKIEQKKEDAAKYGEYQQRLRAILKRIMSVYFFLTIKMGMPRIDLNLEDFETAEEKLEEFAREAVKGRWHKFWEKIGIKTAWQYHNEFGYFHYRRTPFGYWYKSVTDVYKEEWDTFDPEYIAIRRSGSAIPPNALALMEKIYKKKFNIELPKIRRGNLFE